MKKVTILVALALLAGCSGMGTSGSSSMGSYGSGSSGNYSTGSSGISGVNRPAPNPLDPSSYGVFLPLG
jgi:hypothetical protein